MIIDAHVHVLAPEWIPEGIRWAWARSAAQASETPRDVNHIYSRVAVSQSDPDGSLTVSGMRAAGVGAAVIPTVDWTIVGQPSSQHLKIQDLHAKYEEIHDRYPNLYFCAGVDPRHHDGRALLEEALGRRGCVGIKAYPATGWNPDDPDHAWLFEAAESAAMPVMIHTSPIGGAPLNTALSRPAALLGLLARYPELQVVFAHAGFKAWSLEAIDIAASHGSVQLELSLWQRLAERDYPEFRSLMSYAASSVGAHRMMLGSDIIRGPRRDADGTELSGWIDKILALAEPYGGAAAVLTHDQVELILGGTASRVFRIAKTD